MRNPMVRLLMVVLLAASGANLGCYQVASKNRLDPTITTLAIVPLENETTTFEIEQLLTRALIQGFVEKTRYRIVERPEQADAVMTGAVSRMVANPVIFGRGSFGSTYQVTLNARIELRDRRQDKILFQNPRFTFREQYVIAEEVENFFSELNPALDRIARDFAASVVTSILEDF